MDKKKGSTAVLVIVVALITAALMSLGAAIWMKSGGRMIVSRNEYEEFRDFGRRYGKLDEIQALIDGDYLFDYSKAGQMDAICSAALESLGDEYTRYLNKEELARLQDSINSSFTGTGIIFKKNEEGGLVITDIVSGGPADKAGLKRGDLILGIDGQDFTDVTGAAEAIRGEAGTEVTITVAGEDGKPRDYKLVRGQIEDSSIESGMLDGHIAYIRIKSFGEDSAGLFDEALTRAGEDGAAGLIIDLRGNPGGLFDTGIAIADRLLPETLISYTVDKNGRREEYRSDDEATKLVTVVLTDGDTASTAEMLAEALRENGAVLVGGRTYGKGVIQENHMFSDGTAANITTREFFGADGTRINGRGVEPDRIVAAGKDGTEDAALAEALRVFAPGN